MFNLKYRQKTKCLYSLFYFYYFVVLNQLFKDWFLLKRFSVQANLPKIDICEYTVFSVGISINNYYYIKDYYKYTFNKTIT